MTITGHTSRKGTTGGSRGLGKAGALSPFLLIVAFVSWCTVIAPVAAETIADGIATYRQGDYERARDI